MPHFQLVTAQGEALGPFEIKHDGGSTADSWPIGTLIFRGEHGYLRIIDSIPAENPEELTVLVVEPE